MVSRGQNAYLVGAITAAALALGIVAFAFPTKAAAFWPFSAFKASGQTLSAPKMAHDPSLSLLAAATNSDPNPSKGGGMLAMSEGSALIAEAGPEGTPDTDASSGNGSISLYVVREGDTLSQIADMFDVSANTILWANNLSSEKDIHPGDSLVILPVSGLQHTVKAGETLASLAKTYGGDAGDIASFNGLDDGAALAAGSVVIIPGGEIRSAASTSNGSSVKQGGGLTNIAKNPVRGGSGPAIAGYFGNPVPGAIVTQGIHGWNGVDLGAKSGTPIYAAASGTVIVSRTGGWNGGYGNYVVISHANGAQTLYAHMSSVVASAGSSVAKGALIGYVGKTGEATGPHLHFEVRNFANPFRACAVGRACMPQ